MIDLEHIKKTFVLARNCSTGVACIWSLVRYYGGDTTPWLITSWSGAEHGVAKISGLLDAVRKLGFEAIVQRSTMHRLEIQVFPLILYVEKDDGVKDFVVCYGFDGRRFLVGDTSWGLIQYYPEELEAMWIQKITLDLFAGERFPYKKDHRNAQKTLLLKWIRGSSDFRERVLNDWIRESACDCEKEIRWIKRVSPWFCIWGLLNLVCWIVGVDDSLYQELYFSLYGWGGILISVGISYPLAVYWRDKLGVRNWGRLKGQGETNREQHALWNSSVVLWAILVSALLALCGWPDMYAGIGIGITSLSMLLWVFVFIRIKEVVSVIYRVSVEARQGYLRDR
ncbi:MAG: hypothetical protein PARBB_00509 [Parabacteroides distasonis]